MDISAWKGRPLEIWWRLSVPYLLCFSLLVLIFRPTPGTLAHVLLPFLLAFWLTLYSSIAWTAVALISKIKPGLWGRTPSLRLWLAIVASIVGGYLQFFFGKET